MFIIALLASLLSFDAKAIETDYVAHLSTSTAATVLVSQSLEKWFKCSKRDSVLVGFTTSLLLGTIKEFTDNSFSGKDIEADFIGSTIGASFAVTF